MAGELVTQVSAGGLYRESSLGYHDASNAAISGSLRGVRLNKISSGEGYNFLTQIPANLTMGTGLTFTFAVTDAGENSSDLGLAIVLGVTVKTLVSGETTSIDTAAGTEQTVTITLQSTSGEVTVATLAIASANLDSAVVGNLIAVRIRRIGGNASDTAQGSAILLAAAVKNT